jgi:hypothetical protein
LRAISLEAVSIRIVSAKAVLGSDPDIIFAVFKNAVDRIVAKAVLVVWFVFVSRRF